MASVTFDQATRVYPGSERPAVDALDLDIADGEFLAQAQGALRRAAAACRDGPRDRPFPAGVPHGRAAVQPRRQAARADRTEIAALQRRLGVTTVYVTHDQVEAMTMGDRVAVLKDGQLQQVDTTRNLHDRPANVFVAGIIGSPAMNIAEARLVQGGAQVGELVVPLSRSAMDVARADGAETVTVGFRPEALHLVGHGEPGFDLVVDVVEELGSDAFVYGRISNPELAEHLHGSGGGDVVARVDPRRAPAKGAGSGSASARPSTTSSPPRQGCACPSN